MFRFVYAKVFCILLLLFEHLRSFHISPFFLPELIQAHIVVLSVSLYEVIDRLVVVFAPYLLILRLQVQQEQRRVMDEHMTFWMDIDLHSIFFRFLSVCSGIDVMPMPAADNLLVADRTILGVALDDCVHSISSGRSSPA